MENSVCKIKIVLKKCQLAYVTAFLKEFSDRREASVSISSRQTADVLTITPQQLHYLRNKIEQVEIDGVIGMSDWLPTTPSHEMKLHKYECGVFFLLEYHNCRVKINQEIINALICAEERINSFITAVAAAAQ